MISLFKTRLLVGMIFIMLYAVVFVLTTKDKDERIQYILDQHIKELQVNYRISDHFFKALSNNAFFHITHSPKVLELLYQAKHAKNPGELTKIRNELYTRLTPFFNQLQKHGVIITLFSFENNHTFLRLHKPSKFADDLSKVRYSFTYVNKYKKPIRGFEQGKISHAFRNIFPIFHKDEYLGSVDIAFSSNSLQDGMTSIHQVDTHFILNKSLFDVNIWKAQKNVKYVQSIEHPDFLFPLTKEHNLEGIQSDEKVLSKTLKEQIKENFKHQNAFSLYQPTGDTIKIITFSPIKDIKKEQTVAYLVSYIDSLDIKSILNDYVWINLIMLSGMFVITALICNIARHRYSLQNEVNEKTRELKTLNENLQHDIENKLREIREKDGLLLEQAKHASMGEMIGNIAHQWRQPLNALGLILQKIPVFYKRGKLDKATLDETVKKGMDLINKMSSTIDDFRYFLQEHKQSDTFRLVDTVENCRALLSTILESEKIELQVTVAEDIEINGHANELSQVLLNIINNAKDALTEMSIPNALITITAHADDEKILIEIEDNAGGIPENIINKIFEPYFTTKEEGKGTGIGLFMSKRIIEESMQGQLSVSNTQTGAKFSILLKNQYNTR